VIAFASRVPIITDGLAGHVPAPRHGRGDPQEYPRTEHADPLDRSVRDAVDPHCAGHEGLNRDQIVDDQRDPRASRGDVTELRVLSTDEPAPPTQKNVPSNSNATGTTSGCLLSPSVAKRASGCDRRYATSASSKDMLATSL
jgi:hypothetical protein